MPTAVSGGREGAAIHFNRRAHRLRFVCVLMPPSLSVQGRLEGGRVNAVLLKAAIVTVDRGAIVRLVAERLAALRARLAPVHIRAR